MNNLSKYSMVELVDKIQNECALLSRSFVTVSKLIEKVVSERGVDISKDKRTIGQKRKRETPDKAKRGKDEDEGKPISLLIEDFKFEVNSEYNENGYFIKITANKKDYCLGPYRDSEFVDSIKKDIQRCLSTVNNIKTFEESLEELKQMIYAKFPPVIEENEDVNEI